MQHRSSSSPGSVRRTLIHVMSSCWPLVLRSNRYGLRASLLVAATVAELMIAPASSGGSRNT
eukprot:1658520-Prorocentrum_lima.AAC.1